MQKIFFISPKEYHDGYITENPVEGSAEIFLGLEDKYGGRYTIEDAQMFVSESFPGATLYESKGLWEKKLEKSTVILIFNDSDTTSWENFKKRIRTLQTELEEAFRQDKVMVRFINPEQTGVIE